MSGVRDACAKCGDDTAHLFQIGATAFLCRACLGLRPGETIGAWRPADGDAVRRVVPGPWVAPPPPAIPAATGSRTAPAVHWPWTLAIGLTLVACAFRLHNVTAGAVGGLLVGFSLVALDAARAARRGRR
jgi:hypothetical protein